MKQFITGGAGFIGSHLADALVARGDAVTILDNMSTGSASNIAHLEGKIEIIKGDIRDVATVEKAHSCNFQTLSQKECVSNCFL